MTDLEEPCTPELIESDQSLCKCSSCEHYELVNARARIAEQAATIEAALKVTDDMRSGGWHIGKTVPDLGEKLYRILTGTEGTR